MSVSSENSQSNEKKFELNFELIKLNPKEGFTIYKIPNEHYDIYVNYTFYPSLENSKPVNKYILNHIYIAEQGESLSGPRETGPIPRNITIHLPYLELVDENKIEILLSTIETPRKSFKMLQFIINGQEFVEKNIDKSYNGLGVYNGIEVIKKEKGGKKI